MKKVALLLVCLAVAGGASAQKAPKSKPLPKEVKCAVMKNETANVADAQKQGLFADYKGKRYYFCCAGCAPAFKKDPAKYVKGAVGLPIPKAPKKGG
jgi:YHS domain-containing protein